MGVNKNLKKFPSITAIDQALKHKGLPWGKEVRSQVNQELQQLKESAIASDPAWTQELILEKLLSLLESSRPLQKVLNATGVVLHTNLGRSPLSAELFSKLQDLACGYSNLEYDLQSGTRGSRTQRIEELWMNLTGAEAALVVNNNAAAVFLVLMAFGQGKECLVSRGELVEIGGSFRIPDILAATGAVMVEVGATNKTKPEDYKKALTQQTALILKVHTSNFAIQGFTAAVPTSRLAPLCKENNLLLIEDLGSGLFQSVKEQAGFKEPSIEEALRQGSDLLTFSGDKLLGGPQAGVILGKRALIAKLKSFPLYRAFRCDKLTLFLLEQTLLAYSRGEANQLPTLRMLLEEAESIKKRGEDLLSDLPQGPFQLVQHRAKPGGGSLPLVELDSWAIEITHPWSAQRLGTWLRSCTPPVIGLIRKDRVLLDLRALSLEEIPSLKRILKALPSL